jgi:hypothetical protein
MKLLMDAAVMSPRWLFLCCRHVPGLVPPEVRSIAQSRAVTQQAAHRAQTSRLAAVAGGCRPL